MEKYKPSKEELELAKEQNLNADEGYLGGYVKETILKENSWFRM